MELIPFIKKAQEVSPSEVKLFSSPWSAPAWMKNIDAATNASSLKKEYYQVYADYYVKFLNAYSAEGLKFWGLTPQNEPGHGLTYGNWNSMGWTPKQMLEFLVANLCPSLKKHNYQHLNVMINDNQRSNVMEWLERVPACLKLLSAIKHKIDFSCGVNSLRRILKEMGFKWESYLPFNKCWQIKDQFGVLTNMSSSNHLITVHARTLEAIRWTQEILKRWTNGILQSHGHDVIRLPPYMCELNDIELAWAKAKRLVLKQCHRRRQSSKARRYKKKSDFLCHEAKLGSLLFTCSKERGMLLGDEWADRRYYRELYYMWTLLYKNESLRKCASGMAVHWYADSLSPASILTKAHEQDTDKFLLYTEACVGAREHNKCATEAQGLENPIVGLQLVRG
ncbi:hypothetical protein PR048_023846 [Dryococelus australis]|uniref:Glucosylceramidase n=1 Tax=Dryococelus australis TaxID=614101 RepID=A0ABQ9GV64_9NEOP|nr:hypothetical protein PR048_023846 [Dryococelus australis]